MRSTYIGLTEGMRGRVVATAIGAVCLFVLIGRSAPADEPQTTPPPAQEGQVQPQKAASPQETGEVQERAVPEFGISGMQLFTESPTELWPGPFAIRTYLKRTFVTANSGGGLNTDALNTIAVVPAVDGRFRFRFRQPDFVTILTGRNYFVSATGGAGLGDPQVADTISMATTRQVLADDALFRIEGPSAIGQFVIKTFRGNYLTAVDGGGRPTGAFRASARTATMNEMFQIIKCGSLGSGFTYALKPKRSGYDPVTKTDKPYFLIAKNGGGRTADAMSTFSGLNNYAKFKLMLQGNGTYALQTSNGINYVTAREGGGLSRGDKKGDTLQTNRTQIGAWEQFKIVDQGDCSYAIQTSGGWYLAASGSGLISTRISFPKEAFKETGYDGEWELIMIGL